MTTQNFYNTVIPPEAEKIGMEYKYTSMDFALMINHLNRQGIDEPEYNIFYSSIGIPEILFYWNCFDDDPSLMGSWNVNYISDPELKAIGKRCRKLILKTLTDLENYMENSSWHTTKNFQVFQWDQEFLICSSIRSLRISFLELMWDGEQWY